MKRIKQTLLIAALTCLALSSTRAQDNNSSDSNNNNNAGRRRGGFGGDPAQFQQQMMERTRERLEVKDDAEWKALEPLVQKVMDVRRDMFSMAARGFGRTRGGGDNAGDNNNRRGGFGTPSPELDALEKAIEAKATKAELTAAIAKVDEARKAKQAELEKAQANLRKVLTTRQEAIATASGLL
jgi:uncharacterized protein YdeI (BOF family)